MANGIWRDAELVFDADGTEGDSITVRAETPGEVILAGQSSLRIGGQYLKVEGLWFHRGALDRGHVIAFRTDRAAHHSRITNCAVTEFNPDNWLLQYKWVSLYGTHNRVDHCHFAGKTHDGATLVVWLEDPPDDKPNYHRIDHNHFGHRPELGKNGGETIRIGTSSRSMQDSYTVVEYNLFERTNGEHEIISNKSGHNIYQHNTFLEAQGALTLRHGNHATIRENWFLGRGKSGTGGVRVIGEDHLVTHNYFSELRGDSSRASLSVMNGILNSPLNRYFQVKRPIITQNTFVDTRISILFGLGADGEKTLLPEDVLFGQNVIFTESDKSVVTAYVSANDVTWSENVFYGSQLGISEPNGIRWQNPELISGPHGMRYPSPDGPASGKGASPKYPPLSPSDVGPSWWGQPWSPEILVDSARALPDFSYAGYRSGEKPPPDPEVTLNVTDFGATGDDMNDDTEAFKRAVQAAHKEDGWVVIGIPKGRFHLSGVMLLERDSLIVRGSGVTETVISIEKPLGAMDVPDSFSEPSEPAKVQGRVTSSYSSWGGVFWFRGAGASSTSMEVGIEHLSIEFNSVPYGGHGLEDGYNAVYLEGVRIGWIRDVEIKNADAGIILNMASQITIENILIAGRGGHFGIHTQDSKHILMENIRVHSGALHPVGCTGEGGYNVVTTSSIGRIYDAGCAQPNLYEGLTVKGDSMGRPILDVESHSPLVMWNIKIHYDQTGAIRPPVYLGALGDRVTVVGLSSNVPVRMQSEAGGYYEGTNWPGELTVSSLYLHQLRKRLGEI
jgi:poly(beta-D-mannuronate) lyase